MALDRSLRNAFRITFEDLYLLLLDVRSTGRDDGWLLVISERNGSWGIRVEDRNTGKSLYVEATTWFKPLEARQDRAAVA